MSEPLTRYALDPTGLLTDNLVSGEIITLNVAQIRAAAPAYGPYFTESLVIYDHNTNVLLVRGVDYQCVQLLQEATLKFGKEICEVILILNGSISDQIRLTYQVLGGLYQNNSAGVVSMYETVMSDERPVDWINVLNKPTLYTPTLHNHLLTDVVGFEPLIVALERIRNAIVLSDVPAFEDLIAWVKLRTLEKATYGDIDAGIASDKAITIDTLLYSLSKFNFNSSYITPSKTDINPGTNTTFNITTSNVSDGTLLYWTLDHIDTANSDFGLTSGVMTVNDNKCSFILPVNTAIETESNETFRINVRRGAIDGPTMVMSNILTISATSILSFDDIVECFNTCCVYGSEVPIAADSFFLIQNSK